MFFLKNQRRIKSPRYTNGLLDGVPLPKPRIHVKKRSESKDSSAGSSSGDSVPRPLSAPAGLNLMVPQDVGFEEQYARLLCHHQDYYHRLQNRREKANKVATIRQHYYPEGGWGWIVVCCGVAVHILIDGVAFAFGQLLAPAKHKWKNTPDLHIGTMSAKYNLRPSLDLRFKPDEAKTVMREVVNPLLDTVELYDGNAVSKLAQRISEEVVGQLKLKTDRVKEDETLRPTTAASFKSATDSGGGYYKFICHTVIVENRGAGVRVAYGQHWDVDSDGAASHFYSTAALQCVCTVLALFYY